MFYSLKKRAAICIVLLAVFLFVGCDENNNNDTGDLDGIWVNDAFGFITTIKINTLEMNIEYEDSYTGIIVNSPNFTAANGVLIIEFTSYIDADYSNWPEVAYSENVEKIGLYGALYWRGLKSNSVYMADAYTGFEHSLFETIEEAQAAFTIDKAGSFVDWSIVSSYTK